MFQTTGQGNGKTTLVFEGDCGHRKGLDPPACSDNSITAEILRYLIVK